METKTTLTIIVILILFIFISVSLSVIEKNRREYKTIDYSLLNKDSNVEVIDDTISVTIPNYCYTHYCHEVYLEGLNSLVKEQYILDSDKSRTLEEIKNGLQIDYDPNEEEITSRFYDDSVSEMIIDGYRIVDGKVKDLVCELFDSNTPKSMMKDYRVSIQEIGKDGSKVGTPLILNK